MDRHRGRAAFGASAPADSCDLPGRRPPATILIVDDQRAVRAGVSRLLSAGEASSVVHQASNRDEALAAFALYAPDLVILDVDLDGADGLALVPLMACRSRVLVLTSHTDASTRSRATALGASAFVGKGEAGAVLARRVAELLRRTARTVDPHSRGEQRPRRTREQAPGRRR